MAQENAVVNLDQGIEDGPVLSQDALAIIEQRSALFDRIMAVALKATSASDWIDQNGKPYLQGSGSEKVARRFGLRIYDVVIEREDLRDEDGSYYLYTVTGKISLSTRDTIESIGTCSSRDSFFSHAGKLTTAQVDIGNIKKSAYSNFLGNGITRLLGIRNLTWEELAKHGITRDGKAGVRYDGGASKASSTKTAKNAESDAKKPYWTSEWNGKNYIHARVGGHLSEEFLTNLGMKPSQKTPGQFSATSSQNLLNALADECEAAEAALREEAVNGTA